MGLFFSLMYGSRWAALFGLIVVAGLAAFVWQLFWMFRNPRSAPRNLRRPDFGMGHGFAALAYLTGAAVLGLVMLLSPAGAWKMNVTIAYGVFGLVGFLAQMVVGMSSRLLPMFAWMHAYAGTGFRRAPPSPHNMPVRRLQMAVVAIWLAGLPVLAAGLYSARTSLVRAAAWSMLAAVGLETINSVAVLRHAFSRREAPEVSEDEEDMGSAPTSPKQSTTL